MGTRGLMGVVAGGIVKASYNHFDSYPGGLGADIVKQINDMLSRWGLKKMKKQALALRLVDETTTPTPEQIKTLHGFANLNVGEQTDDDWYCLLRELQGNLTDTLVTGYMIDGENFAKDSLFCEWGYLVNFDDGILEVYYGFQKSPHTNGRFAELETDGEYYPIAMIATFTLDAIPDDFVDICEFSSKDLFINSDGVRFFDPGEAIGSLKIGENCVAYSVWGDDEPELCMNATMVSEDEIKIENIEGE